MPVTNTAHSLPRLLTRASIPALVALAAMALPAALAAHVVDPTEPPAEPPRVPGSDPIMPGRLDAHLARLAATMEGHGPLVFQPAAKPTTQLVSLYTRAAPGRAGELRETIESLGGAASPVGDDILAARVPAAALPSLARSDLLERAEAALPRRLLLHDSIPDIGSDRVVAGRGLAAPLTGEGVILGLVDTGLDYAHPTFRGQDGLPRVLALWDQGAQGEPPPGHTQGRLCDHQSLIDESCSTVDLIGHGTHVAATAGGSDPVFTGVAPGVDFVSSGSLTFELLAESARWIFDTADEHGRPAVINMSLGGHYGAHDGSTLEEQALTEMSGPGRIVVVAAGNDGGNRIHLSYDLGEEPGRTDVIIHPGFMSEGGFIDLWNEAGGELEVQLAVLGGDGAVVASTGFRGPDDPVFSDYLDTEEGTRLGQAQIAFEPPHPETGKLRANVYLVPGSAPSTFAGNAGGYRWVLELRGRGIFHGWIASASFGSAPASFGSSDSPGDDRSVVAMPATAPGVISVAAYTTNNAWMDVDGAMVEHGSLTVGDIAFFSSGGPSVDLARTGMKPEIAAPGEFIAAPFGRNALIFDRSTLLETDVAAMRGTSMAAPHVAGLVALLLQARPDLDKDEALEALISTARGDDFTGELPNDRWGHGKIDAHAAALAVLGAPADDASEQTGCGCDSVASTAGTIAPLALLALLALAVAPRRRPWAES